MIIPLWSSPLDEIRKELAEKFPDWSNVEVASWGTYLGFATGPGKGNRSWDKPLQKYMARLDTWPWSELDLQYAATAYNTYVASVLSYVGQLETPPEQVMQQEQVALRTTACGPGNWAIPEDIGTCRRTSISLCPLHTSRCPHGRHRSESQLGRVGPLEAYASVSARFH